MNEDILINDDIIQLLHKKMEGISCDAHEENIINEWAQRSDLHQQVIDRLMNKQQVQEMIRARLALYKEKENAWRDMAVRTVDRIPTINTPAPVHWVHFLKTAWFKYAAAVIILFGIGAYLWNIQQKEKPLISTTKPVPVKNDVAPGSNKATLTLSDGRKVELVAANGNIADAGITIQNANGRLEYGKAEKVVFNTMSTPRGGQYQLTLSDGTNVWLNAASSITYPTAFLSNTRKVTITGEAYFEVKKDASKPFIVKTPKEDIIVLGTSFNVNAYSDEAVMKTSLLEGSVRVGERVLKPGQALLNGKVVATNVDQDIAWKNGYFNFEGADIHAVMRQLERWYNIDVEYTGPVTKRIFRGKLPRNLNLSDILEILREVNIKYHIQNKTLFIE